MIAPRARVRWPVSHRIVRTIYPPIDLFEELAPPEDWDLLASAMAKTDPAVLDAIGLLGLVPVARRVRGPTASIVMGTFTHVSPERPSRFSRGDHGVWYCGERFEVALAETAHHFERFMRATAEPPADADFQELVCAVRGDVTEVSDPAALDPGDWSAGQVLGRALRSGGADGIIYPSVRYRHGMAMALFWPDCVELPVLLARRLRYHWDGARMPRYLVHGAAAWAAHPCV